MRGFERFFELLEGGKKANGLANVLACCAERAEGIADIGVDLAGVCLTRDDVGGFEAGFLSDEFIELLDFGVVTVEDLEE